MTTTTPQLELLVPLLQRVLGRRIPPATLWRWHTQGVLCPDGSRVRLRVTRVGRKLYGCAADVERFIDAQNAEPHADDRDGRDPETERRLRAAGLA